MKTFLSTLFCAVTLFAHSQSYIDSGVRHYDAGEFSEALVDFNEAENVKSLFTSSAMAKLYFYKAMTLYEITDVSREAIGSILAINQNFDKSLQLDSTWFEQINDTQTQLVGSLIGRGDLIFKQASKAKERLVKIDNLKAYLDVLKLAEEISLTPKVELKLAEGYFMMGDVYFEDSSNVASLQKAAQYYEQAIKYYEIARYNDPFSKSIIESLLTLSKRMDDPERVKEYSELLSLAGG